MEDIVAREFGTYLAEMDTLRAELERLTRRVRVLEQVIYEEVDPMGCRDTTNEMIADEIGKRFANSRAE